MADYFSHDYNARNDPKLIKLQMFMGHEGKGIFWDLIEMMYEQAGFLHLSQCDCYAFALRTDSDKVKRVIEEFDLFENDKVNFWNESVLKRLKIRTEKSSRAKGSAENRWKNATLCDRNANAFQLEMRSQCDGNAIKESIVKESIVKESIGKESKENKIKDKHQEDAVIEKLSYEEYLKNLEKATDALLVDREFLDYRERYHPGLDIALSVEKAYNDFWATEAGWKHKLKSKSKEIDWKSTFTKALSIKSNQVWRKK